jgi:hypothetical protein
VDVGAGIFRRQHMPNDPEERGLSLIQAVAFALGVGDYARRKNSLGDAARIRRCEAALQRKQRTSSYSHRSLDESVTLVDSPNRRLRFAECPHLPTVFTGQDVAFITLLRSFQRAFGTHFLLVTMS